MRDRYTQACWTHPATGPLDRFQQLERDNADYWRSRVHEHDDDAAGGRIDRPVEQSATVRAHVFAGYLCALVEQAPPPPPAARRHRMPSRTVPFRVSSHGRRRPIPTAPHSKDNS